MSTLLDYKCPCCGGKIEFDTSVQEMKCPYCDTTFDVEALKEYDDVLNAPAQEDDMQWETKPGGEWQEGEADNILVYVCNSCGGEIVGEDTTAATACPFCGNPVIMTGKLSGALKPDYVIPFKLDKKAAKEGLMKHLRANAFCLMCSKIRIILMKSKVYMYLSGFLTLMLMQISVTKPPKQECGAIQDLIITKRDFTPFTEPVILALTEFRLTAQAKWQTI